MSVNSTDQTDSLKSERLSAQSGIERSNMREGKKMLRESRKRLFAALIAVEMIAAQALLAASESIPADPEKLEEAIIENDARFWKAYNSCDIETQREFLTEDLEFYHDKVGLTKTRSSVIRTIEKNLCSDENFRLRREAVKGSYKVYPLKHYGAILTGEHVFYIIEPGKGERLDGRANFTHVWKYEDGNWLMSRILSYDHRSASN